MMTGRAKQRWAYYRNPTLSITNPEWTVLGVNMGIHCENHAPKLPSSDTSRDSYSFMREIKTRCLFGIREVMEFRNLKEGFRNDQ
jgi:hypothetical protein